jgi:hypothetical protein
MTLKTQKPEMPTLSYHANEWFKSLHRLARYGETIDVTQQISSQINVNSDYMNITIRIKSSSGSPISINIISAGQDGQILTIEGTDDIATVQLTTGGNVTLAGGTAFIFTKNDVMTLHYNKNEGVWIERTRSKNL